MPCYDKKLEASRQDFFNDVYSTRDVDCVITTGELELMMREKGWDISAPVPGENDERDPYIPQAQNGYGPTVDIRFPELVSHPGTSSGSYLQTLIGSITQGSAAPLDLDVRSMRTADYEEYTLTERDSGAVVFRGAKCYGFRNLQNLVRKVGRDAGIQVGKGAAGRLAGVRGRGIKLRKADGATSAPERGYDYVEVMACPGGCINGGGQLRPPAAVAKDKEGFERDWEASGVKLDGEDIGRIQGQAAKWGDKEWTKKVEMTYWYGLPTPPASPGPEGQKVAQHNSNGEHAHSSDVDHFALEVLHEICKNEDKVHLSWSDSMDGAAEQRRRTYFRTQYRAVENEVIGLAVKW